MSNVGYCTFENRNNFPDCHGTFTVKLAEKEFHEEDGEGYKDEHNKVGDEKCSCKEMKQTLIL